MLHSLRRKLTVRASGRTLVLVKRVGESGEHVAQKALLWAMYLPAYPALRVEVPLPGGGRYKPDLLALDECDAPVFWGECGTTGLEKLRTLLARHRATHFVFSKWGISIAPFAGMVEAALAGVQRSAPVELFGFPGDADRFIGDDGMISVDIAAVAARRWPGEQQQGASSGSRDAPAADVSRRARRRR